MALAKKDIALLSRGPPCTYHIQHGCCCDTSSARSIHAQLPPAAQQQWEAGKGSIALSMHQASSPRRRDRLAQSSASYPANEGKTRNKAIAEGMF